ncbi:MAG TPA: alpha/beta fold hydrolase [Gemmatimonadota bacterium]|nr:alpha/beta fold hydrolase [Gemmatimonadota bacterium]
MKASIRFQILGPFLVVFFLGADTTAQAQPVQASVRLVDVDGHAIRVQTAGLDLAGHGRPIVVFESGLGTPLETWTPVLSAVSEFAPAVAYDRAGIGLSEPDGLPPTPEHVAERLHALLNEIGANPPYVLVGHSLGGPYVRAFSGMFPDEIAGLVYVDPSDFTAAMADQLAPFEAIGAGEAGKEALHNEVRQLYSTSPPDIQAEWRVVEELLDSGFASLRELPSPRVPIAMLLAARYEEFPVSTPLPYDDRDWWEAELENRIDRLMRLAMESPEGTFAVTSGSGHYIQVDDPELVVAAIRRVVFPDVARQVREALDSGGIAGAIEVYRALEERYPPEQFDESLLNTIGYALLGAGRIDDAIATFKLNVQEYPTAANPYDSLGDGYGAAGRHEEAKASYQRAVELAEATDHPGLPLFQANLERATEAAEGAD